MVKAVIVGINEYLHFPNSSLQGCVNDAQDVAAYLVAARGYAADDVLTLFDSSATKSAIVGALRGMIASARRGDHLLFHYSGHGSQIVSQNVNEPDGLDECVCPYDFDWSNLSSALVDDELAELMAAVPEGAALTVVLDSCHSGDMSRDLARRPRFLPPPLGLRLAYRSRVVRRRPLASPQSVVVSACASNETAADSSFNGRANGAFTYNWLLELQADGQATLAENVVGVSKPLVPFSMHPEVDGDTLLEQAGFLCAPPPVTRALARQSGQGSARAQVLFDQGWRTNVLGTEIGAGVQIAIVDSGFECQLTANVGVPLRWAFELSGDTTQRFELGYGFALVLAVSNWAASSSGVTFDLALRVAPPFFGSVDLARQHISLPVFAVPRATPAPASPADLLAMIELAHISMPKEPVPVPPPSRPRDGDAQYTGIVAIVPFAGGLFGCSFNHNTDNAYVPPGFVREWVEVRLDPPDSGNVYFTKWLDSDPHIGAFEYHVGCVSCGGGTATFSLHCSRDPAVTRAVAASSVEDVAKPHSISKSNGHSPRALADDLALENPEGGGSVRI